MNRSFDKSTRSGVLLSVGLCVSASMLSSGAVSAEPIERTYPPTACSPSNVTNATRGLWSEDIRGFRNSGIRNLSIECPVLKDNIGAPLTRAFAWVLNTNSLRMRCTLRSIRIDGVSRTFFTSASVAEADGPSRLDFSVDRIPDTSFPTTGAVLRPSAYSIGCLLPRKRGGTSTLLGYHVEEEG